MSIAPLAAIVVLLLILAAGLALAAKYVYSSVLGHESLPAGSECSEDKNCANGTCARYGKGGPLQCCPVAGGMELYGGYDYCTSLPDGTPCWSDAMCAGNSCESGVCATLLPPLQACSHDSDCSSGSCHPNYPSGSSICCPNGGEVCDGAMYCKGTLPDGAPCGDNCNDLCQSGNCYDSVCQASSVPTNQQCESSSQCPSGSDCARPTYPGSDYYICCPGTSHICYGDYYCKGYIASGQPCGCDDMCQSGECSDGVCT